MPEIQDYTVTCDRLKDECDRLLYSVDRADLKIDLLNASAGNMEAQIVYLSAAQADVDIQRKALAKRWFWSQLHPAALADRVVRGLHSARILPGRRDMQAARRPEHGRDGTATG